jgi:signal transduction histidine kinase
MIVPLIVRGRVLGSLSLIRGLSGRRYGPKDLELAEELVNRAVLAIENARLHEQTQEALRKRDELLAAVAHDLKTPLACIKGTSQLVRRNAARSARVNTEHLLQGLQRIDATATKMSQQIDELLDQARLDAGQPLRLNLAPTDLVALARRAVAELRQTTERHHIFVETTEAELIGEFDAVRLARVLDNLLGNAIKYSPDGGNVTLSVQREEARGGTAVVLKVQDQGIGIPVDDQPRVFDRFQRAQNVATRFSGTGLGLHNVRRIVEQHRGTITVESREGVGSTFTVRLPLRDASGGRRDDVGGRQVLRSRAGRPAA